MQSLRRNQDGLSEVVSVVMMISITIIILVAALFIWNRYMHNAPKSSPDVGFSRDEGSDRLSVTSTSPGADWQRLAIRVDEISPSTSVLRVGGSGAVHQNQPGTIQISTAPLSTAQMTDVSNQASEIRAGDYLQFCAFPAPGAAEVKIVDTITHRQLGTYPFALVAACS